MSAGGGPGAGVSSVLSKVSLTAPIYIALALLVTWVAVIPLIFTLVASGFASVGLLGTIPALTFAFIYVSPGDAVAKPTYLAALSIHAPSDRQGVVIGRRTSAQSNDRCGFAGAGKPRSRRCFLRHIDWHRRVNQHDGALLSRLFRSLTARSPKDVSSKLRLTRQRSSTSFQSATFQISWPFTGPEQGHRRLQRAISAQPIGR